MTALLPTLAMARCWRQARCQAASPIPPGRARSAPAARRCRWQPRRRRDHPAPAPAQATRSSRVGHGRPPRLRPEAEQRPADAGLRRGPAEGEFNVYFDKVEIDKLVQTVSNATCRTFILGDNVRGKISIIGPDNGKVEVSPEQFYAAFLAALDANQLAVVPYGRFSKIVEKAKAKQNAIPFVTPDEEYTTNEQMVTRMFKVRYADLEPLRAVVQQLVSQNGDSIPFQPDTLIVNDTRLEHARGWRRSSSSSTPAPAPTRCG